MNLPSVKSNPLNELSHLETPAPSPFPGSQHPPPGGLREETQAFFFRSFRGESFPSLLKPAKRKRIFTRSAQEDTLLWNFLPLPQRPSRAFFVCERERRRRQLAPERERERAPSPPPRPSSGFLVTRRSRLARIPLTCVIKEGRLGLPPPPHPPSLRVDAPRATQCLLLRQCNRLSSRDLAWPGRDWLSMESRVKVEIKG